MKEEGQRAVRLDPVLVSRIQELIRQYPTFGSAWLGFRQEVKGNRKTFYRALVPKRWFVRQRTKTPRLRVRGWVSAAGASNERWAMDVTHISCGRDG